MKLTFLQPFWPSFITTSPPPAKTRPPTRDAPHERLGVISPNAAFAKTWGRLARQPEGSPKKRRKKCTFQGENDSILKPPYLSHHCSLYPIIPLSPNLYVGQTWDSNPCNKFRPHRDHTRPEKIEMNSINSFLFWSKVVAYNTLQGNGTQFLNLPHFNITRTRTSHLYIQGNDTLPATWTSKYCKMIAGLRWQISDREGTQGTTDDPPYQNASWYTNRISCLNQVAAKSSTQLLQTTTRSILRFCKR